MLRARKWILGQILNATRFEGLGEERSFQVRDSEALTNERGGCVLNHRIGVLIIRAATGRIGARTVAVREASVG